MARLFQLQEICLRLMGHNLTHNGNEVLTLSLRHIASLLFVVSAEYPLIAYTIYNRDDVELITAAFSVAFTNLLTVIKISTFLGYKQKFSHLMQCFRQMNLKSGQSVEPTENNDFVGRANKLATTLGRAYCISCAFTGLYFMLGPIVKILTSYWRGVPYTRELPMPMKFPFNDVNSPGYEIAYVYIIFGTISVVLFASAIDGLFISFAINLRGHFQTLQHRIQILIFDQGEGEVHSQIAAVVDYHIQLLQLAKELRLIYMPIILGQFLITSLEVGLIIYQLVTHMDSIMSFLVYFSFCGSIMLQLFIYCYGGEIIKVESQQVGIAVQLTDWHLAKPKQRRCLAFILHRSQRETLIKAGFYEASLANFLSIIRAAMSFIAVIQSIE